jgi:hypothetical protein
MKNFIPKAFPEEEDSCPVCLAKISMEAAFEKEASAIQALIAGACTTGGTPEAAKALLAVSQKFYEMHSDFRVSLAINLGIYFSAERYGRAKKVIELLLACDEYRERAALSLQALNASVEQLESHEQLSCSHLITAHREAMDTARLFWDEIDKWNTRRRDEAFSVI